MFNEKGENDGIFIYWNENELKLENGIIKMVRKKALLKYGMEMEVNLKKRYIKMVKKMA